MDGSHLWLAAKLGSQGYVRSLRAFWTLFNSELNLLSFFQIAVAISRDSGEVDEYVRTVLALNESVAFAGIEPFDRTDDTFSRHK
jgi:hypothetical protein